MNELNIDVFADKVRNLSNAGIEYESEGLKYLYEVAAAAVFGEKRLSKSDIDFNRFTQDDCQLFREKFISKSYRVDELCSIMKMAKPCSISAEKTFF